MTEEHSVKADTEYAVLRFEDNDIAGLQRWEFVESVLARSAEAAIRQVASRADGLYVAVPSRSWKPLKVTTKTETTLVIEEPES